MCDVSKLKVGDVVHVRGMIVEAYKDGSVSVLFGASGVRRRFPSELIVHVEPRPLKVGDRVRSRDGASGSIVAIHGDFAWFTAEEVVGWIVALRNLERAE